MPLIPSGLGGEFCALSVVLNFTDGLAEFQSTDPREALGMILYL